MKAAVEYHAASAGRLGHVRLGNGPIPVLVLHDWLGDHDNYAALMPWLDAQAFSYVFADLRGYSHSMTLQGEYTVAEVAADCLRLADALGWTRFHVIGHSMTGMITQRLATDAPSRIASAIAVCTVSAAGNRLAPEAHAFFVSTIDEDAALARLFAFVTAGLCETWVRHKVRQNRERVAPGCRAGYLQMLTTADFVDEVRGLQTPMLVLVGDRDPGLDAAAMQHSFLAWHPHAQLQVIDGCGHYPMQECPLRFATLIEGFLKR